MKDNKVEIKVRKDGRRIIIPLIDIKDTVAGLIKELTPA